MQKETIQTFKGLINGAIINDEQLYRSMEYILEQIEERFGECFNNIFIVYLSDEIKNLYLKGYTYEELENFLVNSIHSAERFETIVFSLDGDNNDFSLINAMLNDGFFSKV